METRRSSWFLGFGILFLLLALVTPTWPLALTTFGKSNPQNNNNNHNNENKQPGERFQARECATDLDCSGIKSTSCLESIFMKDKKLRCLCGNYREPHNGLCDNQYKGVKVLCNNDDECTTGAKCMTGNETSSMDKRCWCMQGYTVDEEMLCSGSADVFGFSTLSLITSFLLVRSI